MYFYFKESEFKKHVEYVCSFASQDKSGRDFLRQVLIEKREGENFLRLSASDGNAMAFSTVPIQSSGSLPASWEKHTLDVFKFLIKAEDLNKISKRFFLDDDADEEIWIEVQKLGTFPKEGENLTGYSLNLWGDIVFHLEGPIEIPVEVNNTLTLEAFEKNIIGGLELDEPIFLKRRDLLKDLLLFSELCGGHFALGQRYGVELGLDFFLDDKESLSLRLKTLGKKSWEESEFTRFFSDDTFHFYDEAIEEGHNVISETDVKTPFKLVLDAVYLEKVLRSFDSKVVVLRVSKENPASKVLALSNESSTMVTYVMPMNFKACWDE